MSRIARQHIEFPPYLVKARSSGKIFVADICCRSSQAPPEWREKIPVLWSKVKESFGVRDCSEAGGAPFILQVLRCSHESKPGLVQDG